LVLRNVPQKIRDRLVTAYNNGIGEEGAITYEKLYDGGFNKDNLDSIIFLKHVFFSKVLPEIIHGKDAPHPVRNNENNGKKRRCSIM
jgi:hypothetical protein